MRRVGHGNVYVNFQLTLRTSNVDQPMVVMMRQMNPLSPWPEIAACPNAWTHVL